MSEPLGGDRPVRRAAGRLTAEVPVRGESFHALAAVGGARIEHIVSSDTPDHAAQAQEWDEWVLVVRGAATLDVAGNRVDLEGGDWILLPAGTSHRVLGTQAGTHWIAVHGPARPPHEA